MYLVKLAEIDLVGRFDRKTLDQVIDLGYDEADEFVIAVSSENSYHCSIFSAEDDGTLSRPGGNTLEDYAPSCVEDTDRFDRLLYCGVPIVVDDNLNDEEAFIYKVV